MSPLLRDIPELASLGSGRGLVRIPMELDVPFTDRVRALVDTAEFQRLRSVSQLGLASRVYPGATHTRFEHALGVFHNALRYLLHLEGDPRFTAAVDVHRAELLMAASLLHDLGHWPFCHPIEDMDLPELPPHEEFAARFLSDAGELAGVLRCDWRVEPAEILAVLGRSPQPEFDDAGYRLVRSILSGPIDIDKMDYLDRDSLHAGVPYGRNFDRNRLIQSLVVNEAGDGLAISSKGRTAAELMVFARYVMFSEVYWHHAVRSATCMFARGFFALHGELDLAEFFRQPEDAMIAELRRLARGTDCEPLFEGLFGPQRRLYKRVAEFSAQTAPVVYRALAGRPYAVSAATAERVVERLSASSAASLRSTDLLIDAPPPHREVQFDVEVYFPKEATYRPLHEVSPVVAALARDQFDETVKRVRVFAHPDSAEELTARTDIADLLLEAVRSVQPGER